MTPHTFGRFSGSENDETRAQLNLSAAATRFICRANRLIRDRPDDSDALQELVNQHMADLGIRLPSSPAHPAGTTPTQEDHPS